VTDGWQWDSSLFKGAAAYYERGRLPYAPGFVDKLTAVLGLDGSGRLLDVGCGPGILALVLAPLFVEAVGLDPDADMLAEAERLAARRKVTNVRWVAARAEDLPAGLGEFRVVVFGNSFHWTDRDRVAATVLAMLEPGGAFVHMSDLKDEFGQSVPPPRPPSLSRPEQPSRPEQASHPAQPSRPEPPYERIRELVRRYLGPVRRAGRGTLAGGTPGREDLVLARAGFVAFERHVVPAGPEVERSADDLVAWAFSLSSSAPHLYGDRLADFERDLRALLREVSADDRFVECVPATEIMTWRKP